MINRIEKLKSELREGEALLVKSDANRRYLSGFHSSAGAVIITAQRAVFITDFRYIEKARATITHLEVEEGSRISAAVKSLGRINKLYIETGAVSLSEYAKLCEALEGIAVSDDPRFDKLLSKLRAQKSDAEIASIKAAQKITDEGFSYILSRISEGRGEREIALDLEFFMRKQGSEGVAFDTIVVSGKNSSLPHGVPSDKKIEKGDFITMDFGAVVNGYCSDMTRTVAVGQVSDEQRAVYNTVLAAQSAALSAISAGKICRDIDKVARDIIENAGYYGAFGHGLGHSVGLEIHESPACNTVCEQKLLSGNIMTVEPGIYLEGRFGVRIEDMVLVTDSGCENLTKSEKSLIIL